MPPSNPHSKQIDVATAQWRAKLLAWYDANCRDLPWRKEQDPYRIWVSEIMLQQTKVDTVLPYYKRFLETFPTLAALADAQDGQVLKMWEGLGYYSRARNLLQAVREVQVTYGGIVPASADEFASLAGVGDYTKAAVLSIAYQKPLAVVDGNVRRVLCRLFAIKSDPQKSTTKKLLIELAEKLLDHERPGDYNQAVMELGALVCTPRKPRCADCPAAGLCLANKNNSAADLPVRVKKKTPPTQVFTAVILCQENRYLLHRRNERLLQGLWEFPGVENTGPQTGLLKLLGCQVRLFGEPQLLRHEFSHLRWEVQVYHAIPACKLPIDGEDWAWVSASEMSQLAFPAVYHTLVESLIQSST